MEEVLAVAADVAVAEEEIKGVWSGSGTCHEAMRGTSICFMSSRSTCHEAMRGTSICFMSGSGRSSRQIR